MQVLVIGLGGIGSIYSLLLKGGFPPETQISFVARSNYSVILESGIKIRSAKFGNHVLVPDAVFRNTEEAAATGKLFDYVFCTTKSLARSSAVALLKPVVSAGSTIVLIQNGLGIEEPIHAAFRTNTLISCTAYIGVWQISPGSIEHSALERLEIGVYPDIAAAEHVRALQDSDSLTSLFTYLKQGGSDCRIVPSMPAARWQKLVWNASFNCVCTITGLDTDQVSRCKPAKEMVLAAMREIIESANKCGHPLPESLIQTNWDNTQKMGVAYKPSMMLDHESQREMEVDVILGSPIAEAIRVGVEVPTLQYMKQVLDCLNWKICTGKGLGFA